jgi:hypothetical protein
MFLQTTSGLGADVRGTRNQCGGGIVIWRRTKSSARSVLFEKSSCSGDVGTVIVLAVDGVDLSMSPADQLNRRQELSLS